MKSKIALVLLCALALVSCRLTLRPGLSDRSADSREPRVKPVRIIDATEDSPEAVALAEKLDRQQAAIEKARLQPTPAPTPAPDTTPEDASSASPDTAPEPPLASGELSTDVLIAQLEAKPERTPAEEQAYRRLLGVDEPAKPADGAQDLYSLLSQARDAALSADYDTVRDRASRALAMVRDKTDPIIDRVYFATEVRNYGNGDVLSPAEFRLGQRVMAVTDLSNFACKPVDDTVPPSLYYTKMTLRFAIYDTKGKLFWQKSFEGIEYQSTQYTSTMFIPQIFTLPGSLQNGQYVLKVEVTDLLSGRRTEASASFSIL